MNTTNTESTAETVREPDVLVVGEALIDVVYRADGSHDENPGGSPANVALTLGRLGRAPRLLTALGDDPRGLAVREWLADAGVTTQTHLGARTATATALLDASGAATYEFDLAWEIDAANVGDPAVLHTGSIAAFLTPGAETLSELIDAHRGRALISYDPNIRPSLIADGADAERVRALVLSLVGRADVVKASDEDIAWLCPGEDVAAVARRWAAAGPLLVVVTRGAEGVIAMRAGAGGGADDEGADVVAVDRAAGDGLAGDGDGAGRALAIASVPVRVVDTVGAGDTFMGTLLDGLLSAGVSGPGTRTALSGLDDATVTALLQRSAQAAAITVSRAGANPPTLGELDADLRAG